VDVENGSPAEDAGIAPGDVILRVGDSAVEDLGDYRDIMRDLEGRKKAIKVMVQRAQYTHFVAIKPE
ncbi:PDZ domain-containing protein, partial [bacterium]|nr:PDZ domain-containing protein [bacterium]